MAKQDLHTGFTVGTEVAYRGGFSSDVIWKKCKIVSARPSQGYVEVETHQGSRKKFRICNTWQDRCWESGTSNYKAVIELWTEKHNEANQAVADERADDTEVFAILRRAHALSKWDVKKLTHEERAQICELLTKMEGLAK